MPRRDPTQITVPASLKVNRQSALPVHLQLQTQLRHLIATGSLKPGTQLPTVRQLAGTLKINRNTVARVLADLQQDGCLDSYQGRGTFVSDRTPIRESERTRTLDRLVEQVLVQARRLGFTPDEFLAAASARAPLLTTKPTAKTRAVLVECNWEELSRYREELECALPLAVDRILIEELAERYRSAPGFFRDCPVVITTFFHLAEVKKTLVRESIPVVGLLAEPGPSVFRRLAELPEGAAVGFVCATPLGSQNLLRSIQSVGITHLRPVLASTDDPWSMEVLAKETLTVVCSEQAADRLRATLQPGTEVIVAHRTLDRGSLDLLSEFLDSLEPAGPIREGL